MLRALTLLWCISSAVESWALDWRECYRDMEAIARLSREARNHTVDLRDTYDRYLLKKVEYQNCLSFGGYCEYLPLAMNRLLGEYQEQRGRFTATMQSIDKHLVSATETCGYEFKQPLR